MKVKFEVDLTPEEFRQAMGLPDVNQFYEELITTTLEKMKAGEEGYDPFSLMQPMITNSFSGMEKFQETMMQMMAGYMKPGDKTD